MKSTKLEWSLQSVIIIVFSTSENVYSSRGNHSACCSTSHAKFHGLFLFCILRDFLISPTILLLLFFLSNPDLCCEEEEEKGSNF